MPNNIQESKTKLNNFLNDFLKSKQEKFIFKNKVKNKVTKKSEDVQYKNEKEKFYALKERRADNKNSKSLIYTSITCFILSPIILVAVVILALFDFRYLGGNPAELLNKWVLLALASFCLIAAIVLSIIHVVDYSTDKTPNDKTFKNLEKTVNEIEKIEYINKIRDVSEKFSESAKTILGMLPETEDKNSPTYKASLSCKLEILGQLNNILIKGLNEFNELIDKTNTKFKKEIDANDDIKSKEKTKQKDALLEEIAEKAAKIKDSFTNGVQNFYINQIDRKDFKKDNNLLEEVDNDNALFQKVNEALQKFKMDVENIMEPSEKINFKDAKEMKKQKNKNPNQINSAALYPLRT